MDAIRIVINHNEYDEDEAHIKFKNKEYKIILEGPGADLAYMKLIQIK